MRGVKIDPAVEASVRRCLESKKSLRVAAADCGTNVSVVQRVARDMRREGLAESPAAPGDDIEARLQAIVAQLLAELKGGAAGAAKPEVIELPQVKLPVHPETRIVDLGRKYERIAFLSDFHHPFQDDVAIDCAMAFLRDYRPQFTLLAGDYFDCYSISDHDKELSRADFLQDEFDAARPTSGKIEEATGGSDVALLDGNHEERIQRMQARNPGLFKLRSLALPVAADLPKRWLYYPNQTRCKAGPLSLLHGDLRGRGMSSVHAAKGMLDKLRTTCVFGHLHRFQSFYWTGDGAEIRAAYANGHLCNPLKAKYVTNPDWQAGITTIEFDWDLNIFTVQPHLIVRGAHRWDGKTYAGAAT